MNAARLDRLSEDESWRLLRQATVGRIALLDDEGPIVLPVNYRFVEPPSGPLIAIRTRPGNVIEQAPMNVAFEIDGIDSARREGWSVLVRGDLLHATPNSHEFASQYDSDSWLGDRDSWLLIEPWAITGRELRGAASVWEFRTGEYL
jgi:hypothetical protein